MKLSLPMGSICSKHQRVANGYRPLKEPDFTRFKQAQVYGFTRDLMHN
jgi:hypothetical protein